MKMLEISVNINFTNDEAVSYIRGALQWKLPWAPLPFHPALGLILSKLSTFYKVNYLIKNVDSLSATNAIYVIFRHYVLETIAT